jgi:hypothetical protein
VTEQRDHECGGRLEVACAVQAADRHRAVTKIGDETGYHLTCDVIVGGEHDRQAAGGAEPGRVGPHGRVAHVERLHDPGPLDAASHEVERAREAFQALAYQRR